MHPAAATASAARSSPVYGLSPCTSLPLTSIAMAAVRLIYLAMDPTETCAAVVLGLHEALIPISIIFGAVFLLRVLDATRCMSYLLRRLIFVTRRDRIAQLMLLGWSFMSLLEGCSGFGTPLIALAPVLVKLGHERHSSINFLLISNSLVSTFGASGTPLWYGITSLVPLTDAKLVQTGFIAAVALAALSFAFLPIACAFATTRAEARAALPFILLSVASGSIPLLVTAYFSYTFPAIVAGIVGCAATYALVAYRVGLAILPNDDDDDDTDVEENDVAAAAGTNLPRRSVGEDLRRTAPITATVTLLLLSRIPQVGLKDLFTLTEPSVNFGLGTYADVSLSASLVFQLRNILTRSDVSFRFQLLYVLFIFPFVFVGVFTAIAFSEGRSLPAIVGATARQIAKPALTLLGALVLVELMVVGGDASPSAVLGETLSSTLQYGWIFLSPFFASLLSFVTGTERPPTPEVRAAR